MKGQSFALANAKVKFVWIKKEIEVVYSIIPSIELP